MQEQIEECLDSQPLFFNAHSGSDAWSLAEAEDFYGAVLELERRVGVAIPTKRTACVALEIRGPRGPSSRRFPDLKLTCDFSHWVCVAERLLEDCGEIIQMAAQHCHHLHARVGYEEGPQVPDPAPPNGPATSRLTKSGGGLFWASQQQRGMAVATVTPEFGPRRIFTRCRSHRRRSPTWRTFATGWRAGSCAKARQLHSA